MSVADCPLCRELEAAQRGDNARCVAKLHSGWVLLENDAAFRGYCILVYRRHVTELHELGAAEQAELLADVTRVTRAIAEICTPAKFNHALLGNMVPHLHWHIIPRYREESWWGKAIWTRPASERREMPAEEFGRLRERLRELIAS